MKIISKLKKLGLIITTFFVGISSKVYGADLLIQPAYRCYKRSVLEIIKLIMRYQLRKAH